MKEQNFEVLKYTAAAFFLVLISGLVANTFAPDTEIGRLIEFGVPLLTGVAAGLWIHFRFRDILDLDLENIDQSG
ncbi:hypothetical protein ACK3SF_01585 [Candidatus Nanosalina sp. VS9-1]|uniref:hypothetical protein n=1 Tax=Candidatus Nanosalina sp. VS9-1 TaxID=3388566 RepID=UPI0039DFD598